MSSNVKFAGFDLGDIMTRIVPGLVFLSSSIPYIFVVGPVPDPNNQFTILSVLILALFAGELVEMFRATVFRVPLPFRQVVYYYNDNERDLAILDRADLAFAKYANKIRSIVPLMKARESYAANKERGTIFTETKGDFEETFKNQFGFDFNTKGPHAVYSVFMSYMEGRISPSTRRLRRTLILAQNLTYAVVGAVGVMLLMSLLNFSTPAIWLSSLVMTIFLLPVLIFARTFAVVQFAYTDSLIIDYYTGRVAES
ncbi:hypothetical protein E6P09_10525 [Haloferax mediterranei ATCC 33500]|uniref:Uncharacterized protein n=1 Tax=Haloferax mediterranei (strain ATCC 33500 / DSM 1411 / JCM 8866 / NBRC 14739 / NCIMB 2177 / R-4) TaxID=523841 RepID=A0A4P8P512_HALMT|nr:hypothetical protein [Haloferax mediterranei]MDX5989308.1 hypothetical protein [Haloferax mediterranei ATCC 33500]QCQ75675.1 hypothetical protein E6P09_10525 [Haloferax mediterranei ATCC 33500]